jgi:hypothetical protein
MGVEADADVGANVGTSAAGVTLAEGLPPTVPARRATTRARFSRSPSLV